MKYLRPDLHRHLLTDVTPEDIRGLGATCILLDADNTSSYDGTTKPLPGSRERVHRALAQQRQGRARWNLGAGIRYSRRGQSAEANTVWFLPGTETPSLSAEGHGHDR